MERLSCNSPPNNNLVRVILQEYHDGALGGHSGIAKTWARISSQFYWPNMKKQIREYVLNCTICQQAKTTNTLLVGLLHPLPIPSQVWEDISMNFIISLPPAKGHLFIMVVVDRLTKFAHFVPLKHDFDNKSVADAFVQHIVKLHGFPKSIVSNRDKIFISKFWKQLFSLQGTHLAMSSVYHPQIDGQTEIINKHLEMYLRCFYHDNPKN